VYTGPFGAKFPLFKGNELATETSTGHRSPRQSFKLPHQMEVSAEPWGQRKLKVKSPCHVLQLAFFSLRSHVGRWIRRRTAGAPLVELCSSRLHGSIQTPTLCSDLCYCLNSLVPVPHEPVCMCFFLCIGCVSMIKTCSARVHNFGHNFAKQLQLVLDRTDVNVTM